MTTEHNLREERRRIVNSWAEINAHLPEDFNPHHKSFVRDYFRAQLRIARGQSRKARRILDGLDDRVGFREFEDINQPLLAAVDIAVKGQTNRRDDLKRPIEPLFRLNHS